MASQNTRRITQDEWLAEGTKLFGTNSLDWKFVCPVCGHVASVRDWRDAGASPGEVGFSCVGRHIAGAKKAFEDTGKGPCTYAGGGLFKLNPVTVFAPEEGLPMSFFEFARDS